VHSHLMQLYLKHLPGHLWPALLDASTRISAPKPSSEMRRARQKTAWAWNKAAYGHPDGSQKTPFGD
jgi:hypothetical protein